MRGKYCRCSLAALLWLLMIPSVWSWVPIVVRGRCLQSGSPCRTSIGNAGSSLGCCDPQQGNLTACLKGNACFGTYAYHWPQSDIPVQWYLNDNQMAGKDGYSKRSISDLEQSMKRAWDAWSKPGCTSLRHTYKGRTSRKPYWEDQVVVLYLASSANWAQFGIGGSVLAFSLPITDDKGNLRDGDIVFNPRPIGRSWGVSPVDSQEIDLTDVATHEIGHTLGFGHSEQKTAVMYFSIRGLGPLFQGLSNDEKKAICATYPQQQGCLQSGTCGTCRVCNKGTCEDQTKRATKACRPCRSNQDCGTNGRCAQTTDGNRCLQACGSNRCCPTGTTCQTYASQSLCVPIHGGCPTATCQNDADCGPGETCTGTPKRCQLTKTSIYHAACQKVCRSDTDCGTNQRCFAVAAGVKRCIVPCNNGVFCPYGFACLRIGGQSFCLPKDAPFCPCQNKSNCTANQDCLRGICQPPQPGKAGARCNNKARCQKGLLCTGLNDRRICAQSCDPSASVVPVGTIGGTCRMDRSCDTGLQCQRLPNGPWLCMQPCQAKTDCTHGGSCTPIQAGKQSYCLCRNDKDCKQGTKCNNAPALLSAPLSGACAPATLSNKCPTNFECLKTGASLKICLPKAVRKEQEPCDAINRCKSPFRCVVNPKKPEEAMCLTPCTESSACSKQGICLTLGRQKACLCSENSHCPTGYTCDKSAFTDRGFCKCTSSLCKNCGNGTCDTKDGENCETCPKDCGCQSPKKCFNGICTGYCGDQVCDPSENCTNCPDCGCPQGQECALGTCRTFCGNGTCDKGETCKNCVTDCACAGRKRCVSGACVGFCGDNTCDANESCTDCATDCGCTQKKVCIKGKCEDKSKQESCGNGVCEIRLGEGCDNCPKDCQCNTTTQCVANVCRSRPESQIPDSSGSPEGTPPKGCRCMSTPLQNSPNLLLWFFLGLGLWFFRGR